MKQCSFYDINLCLDLLEIYKKRQGKVNYLKRVPFKKGMWKVGVIMSKPLQSSVERRYNMSQQATPCSALPELIFVTTSNRDRSGGNWTKMLHKFGVYFEAALISYVPVQLNIFINIFLFHLFYLYNKERVKEKYSYRIIIKSIFIE